MNKLSNATLVILLASILAADSVKAANVTVDVTDASDSGISADSSADTMNQLSQMGANGVMPASDLFTLANFFQGQGNNPANLNEVGAMSASQAGQPNPMVALLTTMALAASQNQNLLMSNLQQGQSGFVTAGNEQSANLPNSQLASTVPILDGNATLANGPLPSSDPATFSNSINSQDNLLSAVLGEIIQNALQANPAGNGKNNLMANSDQNQSGTVSEQPAVVMGTNLPNSQPASNSQISGIGNMPMGFSQLLSALPNLGGHLNNFQGSTGFNLNSIVPGLADASTNSNTSEDAVGSTPNSATPQTNQPQESASNSATTESKVRKPMIPVVEEADDTNKKQVTSSASSSDDDSKSPGYLMIGLISAAVLAVLSGVGYFLYVKFGNNSTDL